MGTLNVAVLTCTTIYEISEFSFKITIFTDFKISAQCMGMFA